MTIVATVKPEKRAEFLDAMRSLQQERTKEKRVIASNIYEGPDAPNLFRLIDDWETEKDLEKYCEGQGYRILIGALRTLCTEAEVRYAPSQSGGGGLIFEKHEAL
jgi:quinol monooxygenase YgiN